MRVREASLLVLLASGWSHARAEVVCEADHEDDDEGLAALVEGLLADVDTCEALREAGGCEVLEETLVEKLCPQACDRCAESCADATTIAGLDVADCETAARLGMCTYAPTQMETYCPVTCELGCGAPKQECVCGKLVERLAPETCEESPEEPSDEPTSAPSAGPSAADEDDDKSNADSASAKSRAALGAGNALVAGAIANQARKDLNDAGDKEESETERRTTVVHKSPPRRDIGIQVHIERDRPLSGPETSRKRHVPFEAPKIPRSETRRYRKGEADPQERVGGAHLYESEHILVPAPKPRKKKPQNLRREKTMASSRLDTEQSNFDDESSSSDDDGTQARSGPKNGSERTAPGSTPTRLMDIAAQADAFVPLTVAAQDPSPRSSSSSTLSSSSEEADIGAGAAARSDRARGVRSDDPGGTQGSDNASAAPSGALTMLAAALASQGTNSVGDDDGKDDDDDDDDDPDTGDSSGSDDI